MKNTLRLAALLLAISCWTGSPASAQDETASISIPADKMTFVPTGVKTDAGELKAGPAYGNLATGKHGTFVRMPAHFISPLHTHTADYYAVVIEGTAINAQTGRNDVQLPVGSYWFQRGKETHVTKCVSDVACLFFIVQPDRFDDVTSK
ncbi:DUF4437 domain-containing protein [Bradyrhizobium betae]|uniref:DUF4437 domain-containing protein n=1 Tax=Bradyrhizobium betae TaxID=244734 RepID=A0A5P6P5L9_9BRAD|nr:DUF4437 domain-containing protein [Bradyrhizobium betae]MCS3730529.1 hypothetical protein [Bradyrhizobium betae]QFI73476.1 DUF4437 domain-containing protein [Bradyrhizobium betae]